MKPTFYNPISWFPRKEIPAGLIMPSEVGRSPIKLMDAEAQSREGYAKSWIVFRCVNLIAGSAATVPWDLHVKERDGVVGEKILSHPLLDLIAKPNPLNMDGSLFWFASYAFKQLNGNSFLRVCQNTEREGALPTEIWNLEPQFTSIQKGTKLDPIEAYVYERNGKKQAIPFDEVSHDKTFNPLNPWFGMSPLQALAYQVDQGTEGNAWNLAMLRNSGKPSGVLTVNGTVSDEQYDRWKERMMDETQGQRVLGQPLLMETGVGGATWQEMGLSPKDMDWVNSTSVTTVQIAQGYDIPPEMVGHDKSKTFANGKNARETFWEDKVTTVVKGKTRQLNNWLVPLYPDGDRIVLVPNFDEVPAFREVQESRFERANGANFLTVDEKRAMAGLEPLTTKLGGDLILVPLNMIPLETYVGAELPPIPDEGSSHEEEEE